MIKLRMRLMIVILTFAVGVLAVAVGVNFQKPETVQVILPQSRWEPIFFGRDKYRIGSINQATEMAGIAELRKTVLPKGDTEIRIWRGGGLSSWEAIILKQIGGEWSAAHITTDFNSAINTDAFSKVNLSPLAAPKSGWTSFWNRATEKRLFELPDQSELDCELSTLDATSHVVEINRNRIYRTYRYTSGNTRCLEARLLDEIADVIAVEFDSGLVPCKKDEWFACTVYGMKLQQGK